MCVYYRNAMSRCSMSVHKDVHIFMIITSSINAMHIYARSLLAKLGR